MGFGARMELQQKTRALELTQSTLGRPTREWRGPSFESPSTLVNRQARHRRLDRRLSREQKVGLPCHPQLENSLGEGCREGGGGESAGEEG